MSTGKIDPSELEATVIGEICAMTGRSAPLDRSLTFPDLNVDSLGVVEILQTIEDDFGIAVGEQEAAGVRTLGDALDLLRSKAEAATDRSAAPLGSRE